MIFFFFQLHPSKMYVLKNKLCYFLWFPFNQVILILWSRQQVNLARWLMLFLPFFRLSCSFKFRLRVLTPSLRFANSFFFSLIFLILSFYIWIHMINWQSFFFLYVISSDGFSFSFLNTLKTLEYQFFRLQKIWSRRRRKKCTARKFGLYYHVTVLTEYFLHNHHSSSSSS